MSCGLGAVILVFMLVKYNVDVVPTKNDSLEVELSQLKSEARVLGEQVAVINAAREKTLADIEAVSGQLSQIEKEVAGKKGLSEKQEQELVAIQKKIAAMEAAQTEDVIENKNAGEETYIAGLRVEGRKIAILIDSSASMTDEILIDVIRRKNRPDNEKKSGPKWQRVLRIADWLLARLPKDSEVAVIAFDEQARVLGSNSWVPSRNGAELKKIQIALSSAVPTGATNLQAGLRVLGHLEPSNVYLVTDGLPTKGLSNYKSLNPFASCNSLTGSSNSISGECRLKLFHHSIANETLGVKVPVNVVLLPIEGDPQASAAYWSWTSETGGLLISPAESWP